MSKICQCEARHRGVLGETNHSAAGFSIFTSCHGRPKAISQMATHSDSKSLKMDYNISRPRLPYSQAHIWHANWGSPGLMGAGHASRGDDVHRCR